MVKHTTNRIFETQQQKCVSRFYYLELTLVCASHNNQPSGALRVNGSDKPMKVCQQTRLEIALGRAPWEDCGVEARQSTENKLLVGKEKFGLTFSI